MKLDELMAELQACERVMSNGDGDVVFRLKAEHEEPVDYDELDGELITVTKAAIIPKPQHNQIHIVVDLDVVGEDDQ
jgi:hypothetical protein